MNICNQCPRKCNIDRESKRGFCKAPLDFAVSRVALHPWEEPCISGQNGSGTIFFSGCNLHCVFCQNQEISHEIKGEIKSENELIKDIFSLQEQGATNISFVTPTHYSLQLARVLEQVKSKLKIPVVWNCGGYEDVETLKALDGLVDVYLPDAKYFSEELSSSYSGAKDYFQVNMNAIGEMIRQVGTPLLQDGILLKGVMVRHLVLPACKNDSIKLLEELNARFGKQILLSLMRQYTPDFAMNCPYQNLHRKVTTFEYEKVLNRALELGFDGFMQEASSANKAYTPPFFGQKQ